LRFNITIIGIKELTCKYDALKYDLEGINFIKSHYFRRILIMEYILQDTDIFDEIIHDKFRRIISKNIDNFIKDKVYVFVVTFHMNLLSDDRFQEFDIIHNKINQRLNNSRTNQVLRHQLERIKQFLLKII
jgi:hypothetical protein